MLGMRIKVYATIQIAVAAIAPSSSARSLELDTLGDIGKYNSPITISGNEAK